LGSRLVLQALLILLVLPNHLQVACLLEAILQEQHQQQHRAGTSGCCLLLLQTATAESHPAASAAQTLLQVPYR
jgi:hypothetical protein